MIRLVFQENDSTKWIPRNQLDFCNGPKERLLASSVWITTSALQAALSSRPKTCFGCFTATLLSRNIWCLSKCLGHDRHWEHTCRSNEGAVEDIKLAPHLATLLGDHFTLSSPSVNLYSLSADGLASYFIEKIEAIKRTSLSSHHPIHQPTFVCAYKLCLVFCAVDKLSMSLFSLLQVSYPLINSRMSR